jgi:hypothetical protein
MTRLGLLNVVLLSATGLAGCVDTAPLALTDPARDAGSTDGSADAPIDTPCRRCIVEPGSPCFAPYERCLSTPLCPELTACFFERHCFEVPKFDDRVACATPCFERTGILVGDDPVVDLALEINACTIGNCVEECPFQP